MGRGGHTRGIFVPLVQFCCEPKTSLKHTIYQKNNNTEFPSGLAVKDQALSLLWCGFHPWCVGTNMLWVWPERNEKT